MKIAKTPHPTSLYVTSFPQDWEAGITIKYTAIIHQ